MIILEGVSKIYHGSMHALTDVSLHIGQGECCFVLGPSGAGKSTLLKILHALERPSEGRVYLFERDAGRMAPADIQSLRQHMGFIFQDFRLIDDWSVYDNAAIILEIRGKSPGYVRTRVWQMLKWMGLQHRVYARAGELSGGERQRLAIVRAIIHDPRILLADEPVGSLDEETARMVMNMFCRLHRKGTTLVIASHREDPFIDYNRVISLDRGRVAGEWGGS
jgi:cell division transport system ATP-binding protein